MPRAPRQTATVSPGAIILAREGPQTALTQWSQAEAEQARRYTEPSAADNTKTAYTSDILHFQRWCVAHGVTIPMHENGLLKAGASPLLVVSFMTSCVNEGLKAATIERRLAGIRRWHLQSHVQSPTDDLDVKTALRNIKRELGTPQEKKKAATADILEKMLATIPADTLIGKRDRAILLLGFAGAFRRSELIAIRMEHLKWRLERQQLHVLVPKSKTDQVGAGFVKVVLMNPNTGLCPVRALHSWLKAAEIREGQVFRAFSLDGTKMLGDKAPHPKIVARVVQAAATAIGLDAKDFGGHSLRAGFVTQARSNGADLGEIMQVTGHKRAETVLGYIRHEDPSEGSAAGLLWKKKDA
jgi:site-specific recombinase XerD